jgi:hypothetical protein
MRNLRFSILVLTLSVSAFAQNENSPSENQNSGISSKTRFNNQISLGYIPEVSKTTASFSYSSTDFEQSAKILTTKILDYNSNQSRLGLSASHRLSEKNFIGISLSNTISGSSVTKYTPVAIGAGFTDSNDSKSGLSEPSLKYQMLLKENEASRVLASFEVDIPMGASKSGDNKAGGASYGVGIDMVKALDRAEFGLSLSYAGADKLKSELKSGTTMTTAGRGRFFIAGVANMYISNDASFGLGYFRNQFSKETASYSNGNPDFVTDAYSSNGFLAAFIFKFDEEISMSASFSTYKTDAVDSVQGTTTLTSNEGTGKVLSVGLSSVF